MNAALFFSPNGRITKQQFQLGALVLIGIAFVLALIQSSIPVVAAMAIGIPVFLFQLVMYYTWVALWIKRLHQAGQTGWMTILLVIGWFLLSSVVGTIITFSMAPELMSMSGSGSTDFMEIMQESMEASRAIALPSAIAGAVVSAVYVFLLNALLPSDSEDNQYGPAPQ